MERRKYSDEFKLEAVRLATQPGVARSQRRLVARVHPTSRQKNP
jgi:transposase-like protein